MKRDSHRLRPQIEKTCDVCGNKFTSAWARHKRCSKECTQYYKNYYYNNMLWMHGVDIKEYNNMFEEQEGRCLLCKRHQSEIKGRLNIDHDHGTGEVRGLLCNQCNQALGLVKENVNTLQAMIEYVS